MALSGKPQEHRDFPAPLALRSVYLKTGVRNRGDGKAYSILNTLVRRFYSMAKLMYALNQSLDGYVDHMKIGPPDPELARHFLEHARGLTGVVYGRGMYQIMRYWDDDQPDWDAGDREFAAVWRNQRKWIVSRSLKSVGPNATLIQGDLETVIRSLKSEFDGEIDVAGPNLAGSLADLDLIDEYRLYIHPIVLGSGQPFFTGPRPRLRLVDSVRIGEHVIRLTYVPA